MSLHDFDVVTDGPQPVDRELNAAILHMLSKLVPKGFTVVPADEVPDEQPDPERPIISPMAHALDRSIFCDIEVEYAFVALVVRAAMLPEVRKDATGPTPRVYARAFNWLRRQFLELYPAQADAWWRLVSFYWWGAALYQAAFGTVTGMDPRAAALDGVQGAGGWCICPTEDLADALSRALEDAFRRAEFTEILAKAQVEGRPVIHGATGEAMDGTHAGCFPRSSQQTTRTSGRIH